VTHLAGLFDGLFDDASLYPPASTELAEAVREHAVHRLAWYSDTVGPFVCNAERLRKLDALVQSLKLPPLDVAVVVPAGLDAVPTAVATAEQCTSLRLRAIETPIGTHGRVEVLRTLQPLTANAIVYLEIPVISVTERHVHDLNGAGLRLKLRTGGTTVDAFRSEKELARPILLCAGERLRFKCTAGLHHAVRHRDPLTMFEHHGFLNLLLAARIAAATGNLVATADALAERDPAALAYRTSDLTATDVTASRALVASLGTCSIHEPIDDLLAMGLVRRP